MHETITCNVLRLTALVLFAVLPLAAARAEESDKVEEHFQELSLGESVYLQGAGELQVSVGLNEQSPDVAASLLLTIEFEGDG